MTTLSTDPPASRYRRMISKGASGVLWGWKLTPHLTCGCNSPTATIALRSKSETFENSVFVIWFYLFIWYLVFDTLNKNKCFIDFICLLNFIIFLKNVCYLCLLRMLHRALGNLCITRDVIDWDDDDRYLFVFKKRLSGKLPKSFKHWLKISACSFRIYTLPPRIFAANTRHTPFARLTLKSIPGFLNISPIFKNPGKISR